MDHQIKLFRHWMANALNKGVWFIIPILCRIDLGTYIFKFKFVKLEVALIIKYGLGKNGIFTNKIK